MERLPLNPHDHLFRFAFADPAVARDFVAHYLPAEISQALDVDTLAPVEGTFIDEVLDKHLTDALFRVKLADAEGDGNEALIYVLVEHKSYPDRMTARQVLRYIERIWTQEERIHTGSTILTPILPVVFYHGSTAWNVATDLSDLIDMPLPFRPYMPRMRFLLWDLNEVDTDRLVGSVQLRLFFRLMEIFRSDDLRPHMPEVAELLRELSEPKTVLEWVKVGLYYLAANANVDEADVVELAQGLLPAADEGEDILGAIAEVWYRDGLKEGMEQGRELGLEQGVEQGREQGLEQGVRRTIAEIIQVRFGELTEPIAAQLAKTDPDDLNDILEIVLAANSLVELETRLSTV